MRALARNAVAALLLASAAAAQPANPTRGSAFGGYGPAHSGYGPAAGVTRPAPAAFPIADYAAVAFDADSVKQADGSEVLAWANVGGAGAALDASATTGTAPTYYNNVVNGHGAVRFGGTNQFIQTTADVPMTDRCSLIAVVRFTSATASYPMIAILGNLAKIELRGYSTQLRLNYLYVGGAGIVVGAADAVALNEWHILEGVYNLAAAFMFIDGTQKGTQTGAAADPGTPRPLVLGHRVGTSYQLVGDIAYVLAVTTDLAVANRQNLEGQLAWRYGLQGNLPPGHPYHDTPPTGLARKTPASTTTSTTTTPTSTIT